MTFADLKNRHVGESVLICGTGPSLDNVDDESLDGMPRIYLNRTAFVLPATPGKTYWLVMDDAWKLKIRGPWDEHLQNVRNGSARTVGVFRNPLLAQTQFTPAPDGDNIVHFGDPGERRESLLELSRDELSARAQLYQYSGTGATAIHLAWFMGADRVVLAGLDGGDGFAKRLIHFYDKPQRGGYGYWMAREQMIFAAGVLKMKVEDYARL